MEGWSNTTIGEAFTTMTGNTPSKSDASLFGAFIPLVKPPELCDALVDAAEDGLSESGALVARTVPPGAVLISCIGNLGKVGMNTVPVAFNQQINAVFPDRRIAIPEFVFYQVQAPAFRAQLEALATGTTVRIVNKSKFNTLPITLPPLPEQRRIVTILEEAFEAIAAAKANTEKNLQNTVELRAAYLQSTFVEPKSGWIARKLGDLISIQNGYAFKSGDYSATGHFVMRIGNVQDGEITLENPRYIELEGTGLERFTLNEDDILVSLTGNIGRVGMIRSEHLPAALNQRVARITPKVSELDVEFLFKYLSSRAFRESLSNAGHGAAQQNVSTKEIEAVCIFVPPLSEQTRITEGFVEFEAHFEVLDSNLRQRLLALDELRKSLLHQAFTGQLAAKSSYQLLETVA